MKNLDQQLKQLASLARQISETPPADMPPGFTTRVVACAIWSDSLPIWLPWERLVPKILALAVLVCLGAVIADMWPRNTESANEMQMATAIIENLIQP